MDRKRCRTQRFASWSLNQFPETYPLPTQKLAKLENDSPFRNFLSYQKTNPELNLVTKELSYESRSLELSLLVTEKWVRLFSPRGSDRKQIWASSNSREPLLVLLLGCRWNKIAGRLSFRWLYLAIVWSLENLECDYKFWTADYKGPQQRFFIKGLLSQSN